MTSLRADFTEDGDILHGALGCVGARHPPLTSSSTNLGPTTKSCSPRWVEYTRTSCSLLPQGRITSAKPSVRSFRFGTKARM